MKRRPQQLPAPHPRPPFTPPISPEISSSDAESITPFLVSGGQTYFTVAEGPPIFDPRPTGVQLVCSVFVPRGRTGILKQLRVAPFVAPPFADPWHGGEVRWWREMESVNLQGDPIRAGCQLGVLETPIGYESYGAVDGQELLIPQWRWILKIIDGNIDDLRRSRTNIPLFNITDTTSWFLVPNIPVPAAAYSAGIPGRAPGSPWGPQRVQVLQGDQLDLNIPIAEHSTLALFTTWTQEPVRSWARDKAGRKKITPDEYYPILPSFGQLLGYTQPADRESTLRNAVHGW